MDKFEKWRQERRKEGLAQREGGEKRGWGNSTEIIWRNLIYFGNLRNRGGGNFGAKPAHAMLFINTVRKETESMNKLKIKKAPMRLKAKNETKRI